MADEPEYPQEIVFRAHLAALRAGDVEALRRTVSPGLAREMDRPGFEAKLAVMTMLVPDAVVVCAVEREGPWSRLVVESEDQRGWVNFVLEEGAWLVTGQRWRGKS